MKLGHCMQNFGADLTDLVGHIEGLPRKKVKYFYKTRSHFDAQRPRSTSEVNFRGFTFKINDQHKYYRVLIYL